MKILYLLSIGLVTYFLSSLALNVTDGFSINKLGKVFLENLDEPIDESLFNQPYRYFEKGGESYVFISEDGTKVLKLLRASKLSQIYRFPPFIFPTKQKEKILKFEEKMRQSLHGYLLAQDYLKKETGLLGLHVGKSPMISSKIKIIDKCNIEHIINPNDYPFIIQKRAFLVKETITQLMDKGEITAAKQAINDLFSLINRRIQLGIQDLDSCHVLNKNFGFIDGIPIQLDCGGLEKGTFSMDNPDYRFFGVKKSIFKERNQNLHQWIHKYYPELFNHFQQVFEDFLIQNSSNNAA